MICSQCGNSIAEGSAACPRCGARVEASGAQGGSSRSSGGAPQQPFNFDVARWSQAERITGVATVILLVSLFLPWFSASVSGSIFGKRVRGISGSVSGTTAHGYLWVVFVLCLAIIAFLVLQAGFQSLPSQLPAAPAVLLLAATGLNLLLVLIGFFVKPGGGNFLGISVSVSWSFGAFTALIAAVAACVPLALAVISTRTATD